MKSFAILPALAVAASAATVTLETTQCISPVDLQTFTIPVGSLAVKSLSYVCGLKIVSADGVDADSLSCEAFQDAEGKVPGSAIFNTTDPAAISTNPVEEGSILCNSSSISTTTASVATVTSVTLKTVAATTGTAVSSGVPSHSGNSTTVSATQTPTQPSTAPTATGTGAAAHIGMSVGAIAAGLFAFLL